MKRIAGSFRDPAGYVYAHDGEIFRSVNATARPAFEHYLSSGLHEWLLEKQFVLPFQDSESLVEGAWKTLSLPLLPFIGYPYEWCFSQLKHAALLTLDVQLAALERGMILKDASAYNVQFHEGKPVFIDMLSFALYQPGMPWHGYRQFIMHFLGPLALMARADLRYPLALRHFIDGLPLDFISTALPASSWLSPAIVLHVHLHARMQKKYSDTKVARTASQKPRAIPLRRLQNLMRSLRASVAGLKLPKRQTEWGDYYSDTNYSPEAFAHKEQMVAEIAQVRSPALASDLGANDGHFSRILARYAGHVVAADVDPLAVEMHYLALGGVANCLPLLQDLTNPSPALGWASEEREAFLSRARCDFVLALALIHHLRIGNNIPLSSIANLMRSLAPTALIEFVPKEDSQVQRLLAARPDIFPDYTLDSCCAALRKHYVKIETIPLRDTARTMLLCTS